MVDDYADKMTRKTDAELRQYVAAPADYREDAVLAALNELQSRGQAVADAGPLRASLEAVVRQQVAQRQADAAEVAAQEAAAVGPTLYSPGTITLFSVLFNMVAGGVLLGLNLRQLHRTAALVRLGLFIVAYIVGGALLLSFFVQRYGLNPWVIAFFDFPAIILYNWWFWPRYVRTNVYQSRNWLTPFIICAAIKLALAALATHYLSKLVSAGLLK